MNKEITDNKSVEIQNKIMEMGYSAAGTILTENLQYHDDVRKMCEGNQCGFYGTTWACPPAVGSVEECRERVGKYRYMQLFSKVYQLEDFLDLEGMMAAMKDFKCTTRKLDQELKKSIKKIQILSNESCDRCKQCTYPDHPCRFPEELHHSIEGYGFYVNELASQAGISYINGQGTVTFFGAVLY